MCTLCWVLYSFTGLDYWTGLMDYRTDLFSFFEKIPMLILKKPTLYKTDKQLATMDDCNNDISCLLQCFQQCINLTLCYSDLLNRAYVQHKFAIIETSITQAHASEVISAMWSVFGTEIPYHLGTWATKFQIYIALFRIVITKRSRKCKNQLLEPCLNHRTLVTNTYVDPRISIQVSNNHNADALVIIILIKILYNPF